MLNSIDSGVPVVARPMSLARRIGLGVLATLVIGAAVFAAAGGNETGRIAGA